MRSLLLEEKGRITEGLDIHRNGMTPLSAKPAQLSLLLAHLYDRLRAFWAYFSPKCDDAEPLQTCYSQPGGHSSAFCPRGALRTPIKIY
jgi:hypothetical protein